VRVMLEYTGWVECLSEGVRASAKGGVGVREEDEIVR
jgi:hypothetical protein